MIFSFAVCGYTPCPPPKGNSKVGMKMIGNIYCWGVMLALF
jgi:hypothetical protein